MKIKYYHIVRHMWNIIEDNEIVVLKYVKLTPPLSFHTTKHRKDNQLQSMEFPCKIS